MKLFLTGGFLGSGKTTAIRQACLELMEKGTSVGVVTNDQGDQLVDSGFIKNAKVPTKEVSNGCFCCNYDEFIGSIRSLQENMDQTEVIFAESVGSCTDLVATVVQPILQFQPDIEVIVSVFADARVLPSLLCGYGLFAENVSYIYKKQLEEADLLVINKTDLLNAGQLREIKDLVNKLYPGKVTLYQNSLERESIRRWLRLQNNFKADDGRPSLELDYDIYGAGEAALAWLDAEVEIYCDDDAVNVSTELIRKIYSKTNEKNLAIGHLKFLMDDGTKQMKISFTSGNYVDSDWEPEGIKAQQVSLLINARVQAAPEEMRRLVSDAIRETKLQHACSITQGKTAAFQPGYPKPTHRFTASQSTSGVIL